MGGLVGIEFSFRINPKHTKMHVFITTFRANRLCLNKCHTWPFLVCFYSICFFIYGI